MIKSNLNRQILVRPMRRDAVGSRISKTKPATAKGADGRPQFNPSWNGENVRCVGRAAIGLDLISARLCTKLPREGGVMGVHVEMLVETAATIMGRQSYHDRQGGINKVVQSTPTADLQGNIGKTWHQVRLAR